MTTLRDKLYVVFPNARHVRFEGKCPDCKVKALLSYQLPGDAERDADSENCGFYCGHCGWGNAGSRSKRQERRA